MNETRRSYLELHFAVLLFGFTAILGKWISMSAIAIVWWRVLLAAFFFAFIINWKKLFSSIPRKLIWTYLLIGAVVAAHWVAFYGSIKLSYASVTLVCLATTSFMTAIIEPIILKRKFLWYEILLGLVILPGMIMIVDATDVSAQMGIIVGLISALLASLFTVLNKKYITNTRPIYVTQIEMIGGFLFLSICAPFIWMSQGDLNVIPSKMDWLWLIILVLLCTNLAYLLSLRALRQLSAFISTLSINLEPVYGILLAIVLLQEHHDLNAQFYIGVLVIAAAVFAHPIIKRYNKKHVQSA